MKKNTFFKFTIILLSLVFLLLAALYVACSLNFEALRGQVIDLEYSMKKRDVFILEQNKGLSLEQFKKKYHISRKLDPYETEGNIIYFSRLYFHFNKSGILESIE